MLTRILINVHVAQMIVCKSPFHFNIIIALHKFRRFIEEFAMFLNPPTTNSFTNPNIITFNEKNTLLWMTY